MHPFPIESLLRAGLAPPALVLDIGCGTGLHARELAAAGFRVVAADMDRDAVSTARELSGGEEAPAFLAARAEALPFPDASFDAVLCLDVFHWARDAAACTAMWDQAWRVLKTGGLFRVRCLLRDALPSSVALGGGRHRLASGAEWFLPDRALLGSLLARAGGQWLEPPSLPDARAQGTAAMLARKKA